MPWAERFLERVKREQEFILSAFSPKIVLAYQVSDREFVWLPQELGEDESRQWLESQTDPEYKGEVRVVAKKEVVVTPDGKNATCRVMIHQDYLILNFDLKEKGSEDEDSGGYTLQGFLVGMNFNNEQLIASDNVAEQLFPGLNHLERIALVRRCISE